MTVTEELRRLLDERGVKYSYEYVTEGTLFVVTRDVRTYYILAREKGFEVWSDWLTSEQAVEATLGRGTCRAVYKPTGVVCSECGSGGLTIPAHGVNALRNFCPNCGRRIEYEVGT